MILRQKVRIPNVLRSLSPSVLSIPHLRPPDLRHKATSATSGRSTRSSRSRRQRDKRLGMRGIRTAYTRQIRRHHLSAVRDVPAIEGAVEHGQRGLGLVVRDLVAGLVDAEEAEVSVLAHLAVFGAVDGEGLVAGGGEFGGVGVVEGQRDCLAAEPVADVIGVADCVSKEPRDGKRGPRKKSRVLTRNTN